MTKYPVHPDLKKFGSVAFPMQKGALPFVNALSRLGVRAFRFPKGIEAKRIRVPNGAEGLDALLLSPETADENAPCLVYFHGGGFALGLNPLHLKLACEYARKTPCKVLLADYRLAPKHPFPAGAEDCYAVFQWAAEHAQALGIDPERIALGGDSAGGALAMAASLMARDRRGKAACFLLLIYPVADARQETLSMKAFPDTPFWNARATKQMWDYYLCAGCPEKREYASPLEAESFAGLPDAYVETAEFDCLRDEGAALARALEAGGSHVEYRSVSGATHGFELAYDSELTRISVEKRVQALKQAFQTE
ncbi:MAG TPA: alpha/beta hydrolase [Candidatus Cryosericum sp.]|nr:alpha/beta hydrolase [Candidatus Cryosericum sp.]